MHLRFLIITARYKNRLLTRRALCRFVVTASDTATQRAGANQVICHSEERTLYFAVRGTASRSQPYLKRSLFLIFLYIYRYFYNHFFGRFASYFDLSVFGALNTRTARVLKSIISVKLIVTSRLSVRINNRANFSAGLTDTLQIGTRILQIPDSGEARLAMSLAFETRTVRLSPGKPRLAVVEWRAIFS